MHHYWDWGPWTGLFGGVIMLIPILLIGAILFAAYKLFKANVENKDSRNEALETLNNRYANGDISEEEYIQKKKNILG